MVYVVEASASVMSQHVFRTKRRAAAIQRKDRFFIELQADNVMLTAMISDLQGQISEWEQWYYARFDDTVTDPASQVDTLLQALWCCAGEGKAEIAFVSEPESETSFGWDEAGEDQSAEADMSDSGLASTDECSGSGTTGDETECKNASGASVWAKRKHRTQRQPPIGSAPVRVAVARGCKSSKLSIRLEPVDEKPAWAAAFEEALTTGMSNLMRTDVDKNRARSSDYG